METEYKGETIEFCETSDEFTLRINEELVYANPSLKKVKLYIDRMMKKDFKEFQVLVRLNYFDDTSEWITATVTLIDQEGSYWIRRKDNSREKRCGVYLATSSNFTRLKQIREYYSQIKKIEDEISKLNKAMEKPKK